MKKLILSHNKIFTGSSSDADIYKFLDNLNLDNLKKLYENNNEYKDNKYYFKVSKLRYSEDISNYGFKIVYNDWTNQEEGYELQDGDYKLFIPIKMNKDGSAYITSNMTETKNSSKIINILKRMLKAKLVKTEKVEQKKN